MPGQLFTHYFLTDGIKATAEWKASVAKPEAFAAFRDGVRQRYEALSRSADPNEAATEQDLIRPVLELLGWADYLPQQGSTGYEDIPDHLLFADAGSKQHATAKKKPRDRYRDALVVEESKRFGLALDTRDKDGETMAGTPHGQILRYLSTAEIASESRIRWGILTNGGVWRLYDYRSRPRASGYFEADWRNCLSPATKTASVSSISCSAVTPSLFRRAPRPRSWKPPWQRVAGTKSGSRRIFRVWCSSMSSPASYRRSRTPRARVLQKSGRPP